MTSSKAWWQPHLALFVRLSAWIAFPVILAVYLGNWLDNKYQSAPWLFLSCVGLAFVVSMLVLVSTTLKEFKKISETKINNYDDKASGK